MARPGQAETCLFPFLIRMPRAPQIRPSHDDDDFGDISAAEDALLALFHQQKVKSQALEGAHARSKLAADEGYKLQVFTFMDGALGMKFKSTTGSGFAVVEVAEVKPDQQAAKLGVPVGSIIKLIGKSDMTKAEGMKQITDAIAAALRPVEITMSVPLAMLEDAQYQMHRLALIAKQRVARDEREIEARKAASRMPPAPPPVVARALTSVPQKTQAMQAMQAAPKPAVPLLPKPSTFGNAKDLERLLLAAAEESRRDHPEAWNGNPADKPIRRTKSEPPNEKVVSQVPNIKPIIPKPPIRGDGPPVMIKAHSHGVLLPKLIPDAPERPMPGIDHAWDNSMIKGRDGKLHLRHSVGMSPVKKPVPPVLQRSQSEPVQKKTSFLRRLLSFFSRPPPPMPLLTADEAATELRAFVARTGAKATFNMIDANNKGSVGTDELIAAFRKMLVREIPIAEAEKLITTTNERHQSTRKTLTFDIFVVAFSVKAAGSPPARGSSPKNAVGSSRGSSPKNAALNVSSSAGVRVANMESKKVASLANAASTPSSSNTPVVRRRQ